MRFNFFAGVGDLRLAQATVFGHLAHVTIWAGAVSDAVHARYLLQFGEAWGAMTAREKCEDAVRVAVTEALAGHFAPEPLELFIDHDHVRWGGRIEPLA